jgi:hypothetical protein
LLIRKMIEKISAGEKWHQGWCYCSLWEKSSETLEAQGIPRGFCGLCDVCGKPGHVMHFPGAAPFTGSWCKFHYYRTMILHPKGTIGGLLWGMIILGGIIALAVRF